jgi:ammonium transporter, Amt family
MVFQLMFAIITPALITGAFAERMKVRAMLAFLTGIFAPRVIIPIFKDANNKVLPSGVLEGHFFQIVNQAVGVVMAWGLAVVGTIIILKVMDLVIGLRVSDEHGLQGLDLSQHGEEGYYWESSA